MFDINLTLGIQVINFVVTIIVLDVLLIRPIRAIVKKRRDLASGLLGDAESFTASAADKLEAYEAALAKAREEAALSRDALKNEGATREAELLETAHRDAQAFLETSRASTRKAVADAAKALEKQVPEMAKLVVTRLLGKPKRSSAA